MAALVRMPAAIAQATEAAIQTWLVTAGQVVAAGDLLAEVETDKAVFEIESEESGTVGPLLVEAGKNVPIGTPITVILASGEGPDDVTAALAAAGVSAPAQESSDGSVAPAEAQAPPSRAEVSPAPESGRDVGGRIIATPLVRRLAAQAGVGLAQVEGTGPRGRIVRRDLEAHLRVAPPAPATVAAPDVAPVSTPVPTSEAPVRGESTSVADFTDVPLTGMRRAIARRLTESKSTVPHFYVTAHVRVDALMELRKRVNVTAARKISVNDFVLKAVAGALVRVPAANAIWNTDSVRQFTGVDLCVAVALDNGLITPVIRGVDRLSLSQVSAAVVDLAERARAGRLQQHELEGGSFSVSNLGMYGVDEFSAILNPPQSGILAVSAAKPRPVVREDGTVGVATVMTVTLSADHRVVDGALAAQWMQAFAALIEDPVSILV
jgi:pyruvate dehydrogenase E2 component (dihydrolipoamide acetyltransferase)